MSWGRSVGPSRTGSGIRRSLDVHPEVRIPRVRGPLDTPTRATGRSPPPMSTESTDSASPCQSQWGGHDDADNRSVSVAPGACVNARAIRVCRTHFPQGPEAQSTSARLVQCPLAWRRARVVAQPRRLGRLGESRGAAYFGGLLLWDRHEQESRETIRGRSDLELIRIVVDYDPTERLSPPTPKRVGVARPTIVCSHSRVIGRA